MPEPFGWETIDLSSIPPLPTGEIHIYATLLAPDPKWASDARRLLDDSERDRAARFRFEEDRYRFEKTRTALRILLGSYLGAEPREVQFREGTYGKPYLAESDAAIQFNVSHTKGASVLAFAREVEVGVDIEHARRKVDIEGVGRKVFTTSEQASVRVLGNSSALRQFFRLWTAKEAHLKATGSGLSCNPASIQADFEKCQFCAADSAKDSLPYTLREIGTKNQFQVCIAHQVCDPPILRLGEFD